MSTILQKSFNRKYNIEVEIDKVINNIGCLIEKLYTTILKSTIRLKWNLRKQKKKATSAQEAYTQTVKSYNK